MDTTVRVQCNIRIPAKLQQRIRSAAAEDGLTLTAAHVEILELGLSKRRQRKEHRRSERD